MMQQEYNILVDQQEWLEEARASGTDITAIGNLGWVYERIIVYNNEVMRHQYYSQNIWLSWFYNDRYNDLELIE